MTQLSDDEFTVLSIADKGESMMPLGRWEQPVEHLVELGYLERADKFNNYITSAGKQVVAEYNKSLEAHDDTLARKMIALHNNRVAYKQVGEKLAEQMAAMAKAAADITGDEPTVALQKCVAAVRDRAIELLG